MLLESINPANGEPVGSHPAQSPEQVRVAVERARAAAEWWRDLGHKERARRLLAWKGVITRRIGQLSQLIHTENGKPHDDAVIEVTLTIQHLHWAAKNARRVLRRQRVRPGLLALEQAARVEYEPLGVVGVIGPWNYPVFTPMGSIVYALAAGNAVVLKPSEYTPTVAIWLARSFAEVVPEQPVFQVVTGFGETGAALTRSGVDKIAFTGSTATAKQVMAACAETLTPVLIECGGKDALIVDSDADLPSAADAAVWGALSNAGQTCAGVERVYVVDGVYDEFVTHVTELAAKVRAGDDRTASYGPITTPDQLEVIKHHLDDANKRGSRMVLGGPAAVHTPYVDPVVLLDVPDDAPAHTQETFGPTIVLSKVKDADEAVAKANASRFGLGAAVFSRRRGVALARRLRCGMVSVNGVLAYAAIPTLPFGGTRDSGFGRIHGAEGLREFARPKSVTIRRFRPLLQIASFGRDEPNVRRLVKIMRLLHGGVSGSRIAPK